MTTIQYVNGDATQPIGDGPKIVAHVCNDAGAWGRGFVLAVSGRWAAPEADYRWEGPQNLGTARIVWVAANVWVVNMIAQHGLRSAGDRTPIRYDALDACLQWVGERAVVLGASVHMPRIGCGLAGGAWVQVEPLIQKRLCDVGVSVTVYDLVPPTRPSKLF